MQGLVDQESADSVPAVRDCKYRDVARELRSRIESGVYASALPGKRTLATEFGVTSVTMAKAIGLLKNQGVVRTEYGKGTFVTRLKRRRTHTLGILLHAVPGGPLHGQLMAGLQKRARASGEHIIVDGHDNDPGKELVLAEKLVDRAQVDGVVLWPAAGGGRTVEYLRGRDVPHVLLPEPDLAVYGESPTVNADDAGAAAALMDHLIAGGRRKIGFVASGDIAHSPAFGERHAQYLARLQAAGLPAFRPILLAGAPASGGTVVPADVLPRLSQFDAVFCATDGHAASVMACCVAHGIRVPGDLAVAGYDNSTVARLLNLTSVEQHFEEIGERAVDLLLQEIEGARREPVHLTIESELIVRRSTGAG